MTDERNIHLVIDNILIQATLTDEGVVLDAYDNSGNGECIDSTWKLYSEMGVEIKQLKENEC
jgi:hypothetical protein